MAITKGDLYLVAVPFHFPRFISMRPVLRTLLLVCGSGGVLVHAQSTAGTEEFPGLQINSSARPAGLAGAYTSLAEGVSAIGFNPAGLAQGDAGPYQYYSGSLRLHPDAANAGQVAYSRPFGKNARIALSGAYLNYGTIQTMEDPDHLTGTVQPFSFYPALTYASFQDEHWRWGATVKGVLEDPGAFDGAQKALGAGVDAGVQYRPARNLGLGASVVNVGPKLRGHSKNETSGSGWLPGEFRGGAYFRPHGLERMLVTVDAELPFQEVPAVAVGYEYRVIPEWDVRAGTRWDYNDVRNLLGWIGATQADELYGSALKASAGTTVRAGRADVDYAVQWWNDLGFVHALTVGWRID